MDVEADIAMFRKPYTLRHRYLILSSTYCYCGGLLAAIVGLDNGSSSDPGRLVWTAMSGTQVALSILKPIKWYSTAINLLYFKSAAGELGKHIQSKHQLVKNPRYRIYISGGPNIF